MPLPAILAGLSSLSSLMPVVQSAVGVLAAFKGNASAAKANTAVQDAIEVIGAVVPLVQQFGNGQDVTQAQVDAAFANMDQKLDELDAEIARQKQAQDPDDKS